MRWRLRWVAAAVSALASSGALAGYAQVQPPAGWSSTGSGAGLKGWLNVPAANASVMNGRALANVTTTVAGRAVTMPASMRFASNAARVAMVGLRLHPAVALGSAAVTAFALGYELWVDPATQDWMRNYEATVTGYCTTSPAEPPACGATPGQAGAAWVAWANGQQAGFGLGAGSNEHRVYRVAGCGGYCQFEVQRRFRIDQWSPWREWGAWAPGGSRNLVSGEVKEQRSRVAVPADFEAPPIGDPLPDEVAPLVPVPLPVEVPVINPSPDPVPVPVPLRVPLGEPQPVPETDPVQYRQPVVDIVPSPRPAEPWRIDVQPKDIFGTDPGGMQEPGNVDGDSPGGAPAPEQQQQLCEAFPDVAACKPLGSPDPAEAIPTIDLPASVGERVSFGPDTAACPAPRVMRTALAGDLEFSFDGMCQFADGIRPVVVGLAYVTAVLSFFGFGFGFGGRD